MNAPTQAVAVRDDSPAAKFRGQITKMEPEFVSALPPHIPPERFVRVVLTAANSNPALLKADRKSLIESAMKAAQDGLLPDGRDGAFVTFRTKAKDEAGREIWIDKVQWMPMVGGILKKVRNSGDLLTISAHVVYARDRFTYILGDDEKIEHAPSIAADRGAPIAVYAVAKTKDGGIYREVMSVRDVEKVRAVSRAKDKGPWVDWWDEMAKKTAIRRLAKRLPMSSDLDDLIRRDDELYDLKRGDAGDQAGRLFNVVRNPLSDEAPADPETGEIIDNEAQDATAPHQAVQEQQEPETHQQPLQAQETADVIDPLTAASERGKAAKLAGMAKKALPPELREPGREAEAAAWTEGWADPT